MTFRAQIACHDEYGRLSLLPWQNVSAKTHKEAAERLCGKGLSETPLGKLVVAVRVADNNSPEIKLFYRS